MSEKEHVLVVDDEPSIRKYLQTLLEVDGYQVTAVASGQEALEAVQQSERPDFIILDVLMQEMNGLETLRQLIQVDRTLNVIMLSCSNEVTTVVEAIRLGSPGLSDEAIRKSGIGCGHLEVPAENGFAQGKPGFAGILRSFD